MTSESMSQTLTVATSMSNVESELSSLVVNEEGLGKGVPLGFMTEQSVDDKVAYLTEMFGSVDRFTIAHTLSKYDNDIDRCMDVLLNLVFFEQAPGEPVRVPKGIDGFEASETGRPRRKKNKKRQNNGQAALSVATTAEAPVVENRWANVRSDVEFVTSRTQLSPKAVTSAYHANGGSLPLAIRALAVSEAERQGETLLENPVTEVQVAELQTDFGLVPHGQLAGLLAVARHSISAANELARVMVTVPDKRLALASVTNNSQEPSQSPPAFTPIDPRRQAGSPSPASPRSPTRPTHTRFQADAHYAASSNYFNQASAAYRRSKSNPLMSGAAAFYASVGREQMARAHAEASAAADSLVAAQSTANSLDLHGIGVSDGVRIACEQVEDWWESLGDAKYVRNGSADEVRGGFRIVTGQGRHSKGGMGKMGPAVARALANEGWKVEVGTGVVVVMGIARRR